MAAREDRTGPGESRFGPHGQGERIQIPALKFSRLKFRTKVLVVYLIVIVSVISSLVFFVFRPEEERLARVQKETLVIEARQLAAVTVLDASGPRWSSGLQDLADITGLRVTLIAADGRVLGDSQYDARSMDNHSERPEVKRALAGKTGRGRRVSRTIRSEQYYIAVPLRWQGEIVGVIRVAQEQREAIAAIRQLRKAFIYGAAIALLPTLLFGPAILGRITRPLRALERTARQLGAGDLSARVREFGQDELGILARTFNRMATQLQRLVSELSRETGKLQTILATLSDGIIVFDQRQRVLLANRAAAAFLGTSPETMAGRSPAELLLPPAAVELISRSAKNGADEEGEFEVHLPEKRWLLAALTPIRDADSRLQGTLVVLRDLTALRHLERVRQDFVANVTHELRTPLTAIKAMAETLLKEDIEREQGRKFLAAIDAECNRLNALVGDLLHLTRLDSGVVKPKACAFSLREMVVDTTARLFPSGTARRPELLLPVDLPDVKADPEQMRQILINLLDNAVKYSPAKARFGVRAAFDRARVTVTIWDEGPGIPALERERVFERFYRIDKARSRALGGTGLGLSIVKHLVEENGGRVWVEGEAGAEFSFTVPCAASPEPG